MKWNILNKHPRTLSQQTKRRRESYRPQLDILEDRVVLATSQLTLTAAGVLTFTIASNTSASLSGSGSNITFAVGGGDSINADTNAVNNGFLDGGTTTGPAGSLTTPIAVTQIIID